MLAGGRSSRFGSDKALALWRGETLLDRAIAILTPWCAAVVVVGRDWPGQPRIEDRPRVGLGPLGGIAGALEYAQINGSDSVLTIACDMPEVPEEVLAGLVATAPRYCPDAPVLGHWPSNICDQLMAHLADPSPAPFISSEVEKRSATPAFLDFARNERDREGLSTQARHSHRSVRHWANAIGATPVPSPSPLPNVNTPADLMP